MDKPLLSDVSSSANGEGSPATSAHGSPCGGGGCPDIEFGLDGARVPFDFDYCFQFVLPGHTDLLARDASQSLRASTPLAHGKKSLLEEESHTERRDDQMFRRRMFSLEEHRIRERSGANGALGSPRKSRFGSWRSAKKPRTSRPVSRLPTLTWSRRFWDQSSGESIPHEEVEALFREFFVEKEDGAAFRCPTAIKSLEDARRACLDLLLNFFRRAEEEYHTFMFTSVDTDELFLCVKMVEKTALRHADVSEYTFQLDADAVHKKLGIILRPGPAGPNGAAMNTAYVKYDRTMDPILRVHPLEADPGKTSILRKMDGIRLLYDRVTDVLNIDAMKNWGFLIDYYPLHTRGRLEYLAADWGNMRRWYSFDQPIEEVRLYFGEQVALYFLFLGHLCRAMKWLVFVALIVCALNFYFSARTHNRDVFAILGGDVGTHTEVEVLRIAQAVFQIFWVQVFGLSLRQQVSIKLSVWGNAEDNISTVKALENSRYSQNAYIIESEKDANIRETQVPVIKVFRGRIWANAITIIYTAFTLAVVALIFTLKWYLLRNGHIHWATVASYGVTVQIKISNLLWAYIAPYCVDYEHHRRELDYYNALAWKMYVFDFINSFCSFYYIAFLMEHVEGSCPQLYGTCWGYLTYQMIVVYVLYMLFTLYDIFYPLWVIRSATNKEVDKLKRMGRLSKDAQSPGYSFIEQQAKMGSYDGQAMIDDYLGIIGPLSFVLLFGIAMPLSSLLALVCFGLQIRADAWKLTRALRRPFPMLASLGLGVWHTILVSLGYLSMITNVGLVCWQVAPFKHWALNNKFLLFFAVTNTLGILEAALARACDRDCAEVQLAQRRHYHQREYALRYGQAAAHQDKRQVQLLGRANRVFKDIPRLEEGSEYFQPPMVI